MKRRWPLYAGLTGVALLVIVFGVGQLVLPGIAENRVRDMLAGHATNLRVHVEATPAIKLATHHADRVTVTMDSFDAGAAGDLAARLSTTRDTGQLEARAKSVHVGPLTLRDASLAKRGKHLVGRATVTNADLTSALPSFFHVTPIASPDGQLVFQGTMSFLGANLSLRARLVAANGNLVVEPDAFQVVGVTIFKDPRVLVDRVSSAAVAGGFVVTARGRLGSG